MLNKIVNTRNFLLLFLWIFFIVSILVAALHESLMWRAGSVGVSILTIMIIFTIRDAFKSGAFPETNRILRDAEETIFKFIDSAQIKILIFSGRLNPLLFTDEVFKALQRAKERNVDIQVILNHRSSKQQDMIHWLTQNASYFGIIDKGYSPHFMVVDDSHVRAEHIHKEGGKFRTADLNFYTPHLAEFYTKKFKKRIEKATKITIDMPTTVAA